MGLTDDDVREILRLIDESELDELQIETDGFSLHVRRAGAPAEPDEPDVEAPREPDPAELLTVASPMLGVFYRAGAPGGSPFVEVGDLVQPETTVCIIEVMKMMNSVPAGVSGRIVEVVPENATLVEYDAPLFVVRPE